MRLRQEAATCRDRKSSPHTEICPPVPHPKGKGFQLKDLDPGDTCGLKRGEAAELLSNARRGWRKSRTCSTPRTAGPAAGVQALDAPADGTIKHVMPGVNPQGPRCPRSSSPRRRNSTTTSCGATSNTRERGRIGIQPFVLRGVLVVRVHSDPEGAEAALAARRQGIWDGGLPTSRVSRTTPPGGTKILILPSRIA